jgi:hypothetical protein
MRAKPKQSESNERQNRPEMQPAKLNNCMVGFGSFVKFDLRQDDFEIALTPLRFFCQVEGFEGM